MNKWSFVNITPWGQSFFVNVIAWHTQACPHLELKTRPRFCPWSSILFLLLWSIMVLCHGWWCVLKISFLIVFPSTVLIYYWIVNFPYRFFRLSLPKWSVCWTSSFGARTRELPWFLRPPPLRLPRQPKRARRAMPSNASDAWVRSLSGSLPELELVRINLILKLNKSFSSLFLTKVL